MKYHNTHFMQVPREIWEHELSDQAIIFYLWLKELEQRYCGEEKDWFFHMDDQFVEELNWSIAKVKRVKKELLQTNLVQTWQAHYVNDKSKKMSEKHITCYRLR